MNVGGFFASLVLTTEKKSFDEGVAGIKRIGEGIKEADENFGQFVKKSIQGLIAVTAAAIGAGGAISMIQSKALLSAQVAGMNTEAYTNWANAMKLVIGTADGFDAGAAKLQRTFTNIVSDPQAYEKLANDLALISRSLNITDLGKMSNSDRIKAILDTAASGGDRGFEFSANMVGSILGPQFTTLLYGLREQKSSIGQKLNEADSLRAVSTSSQRDAMQNAASLNRLTVAGEQVGDVSLTALLKGLKPTLDSLTQWLIDNKETITKAFETLGIILNQVLQTLGTILSVFGGAFHEIGMMSKIGEFNQKNPYMGAMVESLIKKGGVDLPGALAQLVDPAKSAEGLRFHNIQSEAIDMINNLEKYQKSITAADENKIFGGSRSQVVNIDMGGFSFDAAGTGMIVNYLKDNPGANKADVARAAMVVIQAKSAGLIKSGASTK
jgi:hypothetical protein